MSRLNLALRPLLETLAFVFVFHTLVPATSLAAAADGAPRALELPSPRVRPWVPPQFDSLQTWAAEARAAFRDQASDAIDSVTVTPYNRAAAIALSWIRSLGRERMIQAKAVEAALDSLGFDTELVGDPVLPEFVLLVVRNPFRLTAHPMGFLFWYRGDRAFEQGFEMHGGNAPMMRVWWTGEGDAPYEWAIVHRTRGEAPRLGFFLFRLTKDGGFWRPGQYDGKGPELGDAHEAALADINGDGLPELVTWSEAAQDTLFEPCTGCPKRLIERTYTERKFEGFALHDSRLVPDVYSIFVLFIHLLVDHNRAAASRLLVHPEKIDEAIGLGWGTRRSPGSWMLERSEDERWPRWLEFRFRGTRGIEHFMVRFTEKDGRWIIEDWKHAATASAPGAHK